jgi:radical SAM superfamily enzyme YgiQ (UPF0313 family)
MNNISVDLVYPHSTTGSENYSCEPPLGPLAIYSSLTEELRSSVRFLDSTILSASYIDSQLQKRMADVVAISCTTYNYPEALRLAHQARENGSVVLLGGIHVTHLADRILSKMQDGSRPIDYLIPGFGEPAFGSFLSAIQGDIPLGEVVSLSYILDGHIIRNPSAHSFHGMDPLQNPIDYSIIDFETYSSRIRKIGSLSDLRIGGAMFTQRGCIRSGAMKCEFCSVESRTERRPLALIERDIRCLIENHGLDYIRINDGDLAADVKHMETVAVAAERAFAITGKRPRFYCFVRADEVDSTRMALMKRINILSGFIGYESGSDRMLASMHKGFTREANLSATKILMNGGISVLCGGLVLGAEGETEGTIGETLAFVKDLKKIGNTATLMVTPFIPLPGSPSFQRLLGILKQSDPERYRKYSKEDIFDLFELVEIWNHHMSQVSLPRIQRALGEIADIFEMGIKLINWGQDVNCQLSSGRNGIGLSQ